MTVLSLGLLGRFEARLPAGPLTLRVTKGAALLAYLALEGPTPRESVAALLWERDRQHARQSLRSTLSLLAQDLGASTGVLQTGRAVVALDRAAVTLDVDHLDTTDPNAFLALWRGPFLAGLTIRDSAAWDDWHQRWESQLTHRYIDRALALTGTALREGRNGEAVRLAQRILELDPFSTEGARLLLLAHEHTGKTASARLFRADFEERYKREYGEAPHLPQVNGPISSSPSTATHSVTPQGLPSPLTEFIGRRADLTRLHDLLRGGARLVTVHGPGGIGKTRLAQQVAWELVRHPGRVERVRFIPLDTCTDPAAVPLRLAQVLGVPLNAEPDPVPLLARALGSARELLILDHFNDLLGATPLLLRLLETSPGLTFLVTSRERLQVKGESVVVICGLDVPRLDASDTEFDQTDAVQLFHARANQVSPFTLTGENRPLVARICHAVGGSPLGVELAAAWTGVLPLDALATELDHHALHLRYPVSDVPDRHRSLAHALEASWRRLTPDEQHVLARLSVFRGGFTWEAARDVAGATMDTLANLSAKALITLMPTGRARFHTLVREFAATKLVETEPVLAQHAAYFRDRLETLNRQAAGAVSPELIALLRDEEANVREAVRFLLASRAYPDLARIAEPLLWYYPLMGRFRDGLKVCESLLTAFEDAPAGQEARISFLIGYAWLTLFAGDVPQAITLGREAVQRLNGNPDTLLCLRALDSLGQAYGRAFQLEEGEEVLRQAEHLARNLGDPTRLMRTLNNLGLVLALGGTFDEARRSHDEAYALYQSGKVAPGMDVIWLLSNMAVERLLRNDLHGARERVQEGLRMTAALGAHGQEPILLAVQDLIDLETELQAQGTVDLGALEARMQQTLARTEASGEVFARALLLGLKGRLALLTGENKDGAREVLRGLEFAWNTKNLLVCHWLLPYAAPALAEVGDPATAAELHAFLCGDSPLGPWDRQRAEREWRTWQDLSGEVVTLSRGTFRDLPGVAGQVHVVLSGLGKA